MAILHQCLLWFLNLKLKMTYSKFKRPEPILWNATVKTGSSREGALSWFSLIHTLTHTHTHKKTHISIMLAHTRTCFHWGFWTMVYGKPTTNSSVYENCYLFLRRSFKKSPSLWTIWIVTIVSSILMREEWIPSHHFKWSQCRSVKIGERQSEYGFHSSFDRELSGESPWYIPQGESGLIMD